MKFFNKPKTNERYEPMVSLKTGSLVNIVNKFKALEAEAAAFVEQNAKKISELRSKIDVLEVDQKQAESIKANLSKFLGKE